MLSSFDLKILFLKFNVIKFKEQSLAYMIRPVVLKISTWHICVNRHLSLDITWQKIKKKKCYYFEVLKTVYFWYMLLYGLLGGTKGVS